VHVAILSDIHDNLEALRRGLTCAREAGAGAVICCGDLCSPFVVPVLGNGFDGPVHVVFGNNDGDRFRIAAQAARFGHLTLHGEFADLDLGGRRFAVQHFDDVGRALAGNPVFDVVCFGHSHRYGVERNHDTWAVNPGEIHGGLTGRSTMALYDGAKHVVSRVDL
jgi:putative phosphoesterase